jgi:hypothetical protein
MSAQVPVLAYDAGAVGETLGGAAVLVRTREPVVLAELVAQGAGRSPLISGCERASSAWRV